MSVSPVKENCRHPWPAGQVVLYRRIQSWMNSVPFAPGLPLLKKTNCCQPQQPVLATSLHAALGDPLHTVPPNRSVLIWSE